MQKWEDKSPYYNMLSMGPGKKLKKRGGKMLKPKKQTNLTKK